MRITELAVLLLILTNDLFGQNLVYANNDLVAALLQRLLVLLTGPLYAIADVTAYLNQNITVAVLKVLDYCRLLVQKKE